MIGSNVPTVGGLKNGFKYARDWACEAIQIYVTLSRRWEVASLSQQQVAEFRSAWGDSDVKEVIAHVPFLVNLASPNGSLREKSISRLITEMRYASEFGVQFLVLHPGSYGNSTRRQGLRWIAEGLDFVLRAAGKVRTMLLLETMAGQGTALGSRFEEIAYLLENAGRPRSVGVCFDTGHVFMAGYNFSGYVGYEQTLNLFDQVIGVDRIRTFHLNDSKTQLASKVDRHAGIGEGEMGLQVFHALLRDPRFSSIPKVLEVPDRDTRSKGDLQLLRGLALVEKPIREVRRGQYTLFE